MGEDDIHIIEPESFKTLLCALNDAGMIDSTFKKT